MALGTRVQYLTPGEVQTTSHVGASANLTGGEDRVWQMWTARAQRNAL